MTKKEKPFETSSHQGTITVNRPNSKYYLHMTPGESVKAAEIVGMALSAYEMSYIPKHITNSPFVIRFFDNKVFALERTDDSGSIPFRWSEGDELIRVINMGRGICLNEQTHGKALSSGPVQANFLPGDEPI